MEPLELKADLTPCGLMTAAAAMLCLPLFLMMLVSGHWLAALLMLTPAPPWPSGGGGGGAGASPSAKTIWRTAPAFLSTPSPMQALPRSSACMTPAPPGAPATMQTAPFCPCGGTAACC